jgi:hypothetical protein
VLWHFDELSEFARAAIEASTRLPIGVKLGPAAMSAPMSGLLAGLRESQTSYARPKRMASSTFSSSFRGGTTSGGKPTAILQPSPGTSRKCS